MTIVGKVLLEHVERCERCQRQDWCREGIDLAKAWSEVMAEQLVPAPTAETGEPS